MHAYASVFALGHLSHLLADLAFGHVPLAYPLAAAFKHPSMAHSDASVRALRLCEALGAAYLFCCAGLRQRLGAARLAALVALCLAVSCVFSFGLAGRIARSLARRRA